MALFQHWSNVSVIHSLSVFCLILILPILGYPKAERAQLPAFQYIKQTTIPCQQVEAAEQTFFKKDMQWGLIYIDEFYED